ncbi:hypothetical protein R1flu_026090 [Riccia fluitans]|uniref:Uncharacterized protein n=1 Tax=Riccia fluitans TaxID=41844 RepID=A0ABD1XF03_9MARC
MFLRPPSWADDPLRASSSSSSSSQGAQQSAIVDFANSLTNQRLYREVSLSLRTGLRDAKAEFSFLRVKGLRSLVKFLASAVESEKIIELFVESQTYLELQVVPVLFEHTLATPRRDSDDQRIISPPSVSEIGLALRILEGCCLLDASSRLFASRHSACKELLSLLMKSEQPEQTACLNALLAVLLDSPASQKDLEQIQGVQKIAELVKSTEVDDTIRLQCAEFLLLLIDQVLPKQTKPADGPQSIDARKNVLTAEGAKEDVIEILGRQAGAILDSVGSTEAATSDFDSKQTSVRTLAQRLLDMS